MTAAPIRRIQRQIRWKARPARYEQAREALKPCVLGSDSTRACRFSTKRAMSAEDGASVGFVPDAGHPDAFSSLRGRTLLVACVTIGNVPQLAGELLCAGGSTSRVGRLRAPALLPFAGLSATGEIVGGAEVHVLPGGAVLLQHRAPAARGRAAEHGALVAAFAAAAGVSEVVLLASTNAAGRRDAQLARQTAGPFAGIRFARGPGAEPAAAPRAAAVGVPLLEGTAPKGVWAPVGEQISFLPLARPSSFVRAAFDAAAAADVPTALIVMFAHEGENSADATALACAAAHVANVDVGGKGAVAEDAGLARFLPHFVVPETWSAVAPPPEGLY